MGIPAYKNRVGNTVTGTPGTGTITLSTAETGHQTFASAYGANANVDILIEEGSAWEIARDCTYTHSGTTVTRGTLEASSTGSALNLTSAAKVYVIDTADRLEYQQNRGYVNIYSDNSTTQTLTMAAFNRIRGNSDTPSNGPLMVEGSDDRAWFDPTIARFTPGKAGKYLVNYGVLTTLTYSTTAGKAVYFTRIYKNGSGVVTGTRAEADFAASSLPILGSIGSGIVEMNGSTDYIELYVYVSGPTGATAATTATVSGTYLQIVYLGG